MTEIKQTSAGADEQVLRDLLQRWFEMANVEKRGLIALANESQTAMDLVEVSINNLSERFLELANLSQQQAKRITDFSQACAHVEIQGQKMSFSEVFQTFDQDLSRNLGKILNLAKNSVALSYHLDDVETDVQKLKAKLANNEPIEAADLDNLSQDLINAKSDIGSIATVDLQDKIVVKDRISELLCNVIKQSKVMENALVKSSADATAMSEHISEIITQMQFQDRTSQRLQQISTTLHVLVEMLDSLGQEAAEICDIDNQDSFDSDRFEKIISNMNLEEVRERFVRASLLEGEQLSPHEADTGIAHSDASDDIELF